VGIENDLDHRQHAARLEGREEFGESGGTVGNFSKDGQEDRPVKAI